LGSSKESKTQETAEAAAQKVESAIEGAILVRPFAV
jgi:hypothetical protein